MRYEKNEQTRESFVELVLEGARVHVARGARDKGDVDWSMKDSDVRTYIFDGDAEKARASYEERAASLLDDGYVPAGEATPIITSYVAKRELDRVQNAAHALLVGWRKKSRQDAVAEAKAILAQWHEALVKLDDLTAGSLGKVYGDRITQLEALIESERPR